jgi:hypothetical protein
MIDVLLVGGAIVAALIMVIAMCYISLRISDRKSNEDIKKKLPDATNSNSGGFWF